MVFTECLDKADKINTITDFLILNVFVESVSPAVILAIYGPMIYTTLYAFDAGKSITRESGRCFFRRCEMASSRQCHLGPKKVEIPGPKPLPLVQVMDLPASKAFVQGCINQRSGGTFTYMSFQGP